MRSTSTERLRVCAAMNAWWFRLESIDWGSGISLEVWPRPLILGIDIGASAPDLRRSKARESVRPSVVRSHLLAMSAAAERAAPASESNSPAPIGQMLTREQASELIEARLKQFARLMQRSMQWGS